MFDVFCSITHNAYLHKPRLKGVPDTIAYVVGSCVCVLLLLLFYLLLLLLFLVLLLVVGGGLFLSFFPFTSLSFSMYFIFSNVRVLLCKVIFLPDALCCACTQLIHVWIQYVRKCFTYFASCRTFVPLNKMGINIYILMLAS